MATKFYGVAFAVLLLISVAVAHEDSSSPSDSGSYSSDESVSERLEARLHRCVRFASPGLVVPVANFGELAKVEKCAMEGVTALYNHKPPPAVNDQIQACVDGKSFPEEVKKGVKLFKACVKRALL